MGCAVVRWSDQERAHCGHTLPLPLDDLTRSPRSPQGRLRNRQGLEINDLLELVRLGQRGSVPVSGLPVMAVFSSKGIGYLIKLAVTKRGEEHLTYPQRALFDRIGIRRQVLETDPYGNFIFSGYDYGTARNWARLGLLYLQDGMWEGQRLLPEGWATFVSTPAPAWRQRYGGFFWLNRTGVFDLPADAYYALGAGARSCLSCCLVSSSSFVSAARPARKWGCVR